MNLHYLLIGLFCGLAVGYAFGWQERVRTRRLLAAKARRTALLDARSMVDSNRCSGDSQWAQGINEARRVNLCRIDRLIEEVVDCQGGVPCSACPDKRVCQKGCVRQVSLEVKQ
jgi:hypothetical protein